jgi:hypothetical protein
MSGIARAGLSANELLAPQEFWQKQQQVNAYTQGVGLQAQHQERELEDHDQAQIANVAGYLLSQPEEKRADAWANIYQGLPDHIRSRAPSSYMGEQWLQGAYNRAIPAAERWKQAQLTAGTDSILRSVGGGGGGGGGAPGGPGVAGGGAPAGGAPPATAYATAAPAAAPAALMPYFQEASKETGIPVERLVAQARQESNFDANATGGAGERGIMQIHPRTAAAPGFGMQPIDPAALTDPRSNIMWGARYLKARMGGGDPTDPNVWTRGLAGYNGGGDPNYVQNVTRYLAPPGGGPAPAQPRLPLAAWQRGRAEWMLPGLGRRRIARWPLTFEPASWRPPGARQTRCCSHRPFLPTRHLPHLPPPGRLRPRPQQPRRRHLQPQPLQPHKRRPAPPRSRRYGPSSRSRPGSD